MTLVGARDLFDAADGCLSRSRASPRWHDRRARPHPPRAAGRALADGGGGGARAMVLAGAAGSLTVAERTWVPAMVRGGRPRTASSTPEVLDWYARFAEGHRRTRGEATGIRDVASGPLLRIGDDRFIPACGGSRHGARAQRRPHPPVSSS